MAATAACLGLVSAQPALADNSLIVGTDPDLQAGASALRARSFQDGVQLTERGLETTVSVSNRAAGLSNLCAGYTGLGKYEEAIDACSESLRIKPRNWRSFNNRALAYLFKGALIQARRDVDAGLAINPNADTLNKVDLMIREEEARREMLAAVSGPAAGRL